MPRYFAAIVARDLTSVSAEFDCYGCALRWGAARVGSWDATDFVVGVVGGREDQWLKREAASILKNTWPHSGRALLPVRKDDGNGR